MKTAEEWDDDKGLWWIENGSDEDLYRFIRAIQRDALEEAARECSKIQVGDGNFMQARLVEKRIRALMSKEVPRA